MAIPSRTRKRVQAIPRGADGSAFQKCNMCGNSVAIALADMHECQSSQEMKKFKGIRATKNGFIEQRFLDQPRSAFCFFMEEFKGMHKSEDPIETDRNGFKTWTNMSKEERQPYITKAALVNFHFDKALREEEDRFYKPDVEATKTSNWVCDLWQDCSDSGWHTYVPGEDKIVTARGKSDCDHEWHDNSGDSDHSGWLF